MSAAPEKMYSNFDIRLLLDEGEWSPAQKVVMLLAALAIICDGIDIQLMGLAVPAIAKAWGLTRASFAAVLGFGLFGIASGTALGGFLGDRWGRRKTLIGAIAFLGVMTLSIAFAHTVTEILVLRFLVGVGIGAALPNATALTAECTPRARRPLAITMTIVCIPGGGLIAGLVAARVLTSFHWQALFVLGGVFPLLLAAVLLFALPESPRYLQRQPNGTRSLLQLLRRMGRQLPDDATFYDAAEEERSPRSTVSEIFGPTQLRNTLTLWGSFSATLAAVYLIFNWLPSLMSGLGFTVAVASSALAMYNLGGIAGALLFAWWIGRIGSRVPLLLAVAASGGSALVLCFLPMTPASGEGMVVAVLTVHGFFINAVQTTMYALASHLYVSRVRATGVAAALAMGRAGAIASAFLGAGFLHSGKNSFFEAIVAATVVVFACLALMKGHIEGTRPLAA